MKDKVWNLVLDSALKLPYVKVNRNDFLQEELKVCCEPIEIGIALKESPVHVIDKKKINKIADGCIEFHLQRVTAMSALTAIPGGWWALGAVPVDLAQFYGQVLCLAQKIMYLYGWPDITDEEDKFDDASKQILTLFVGVMLGAGLANQALKELQKQLAEQVVKRVPRMTFAHKSFFILLKQVCKWIGVKLTKKKFAEFASKAIPFISAGISGVLTYYTFKPMAKRLKKHCEDSWDFKTNNFKV